MSRILIIGYGNTLRGDDAAGVRAAELMGSRHPELEVVLRHQLTPELSEQIAASDIVFFLDAETGTTQPNARLIEPAVEADQPRTHFFSPESLLALSRELHGRVPSKAYVIGIPAFHTGFTEELSAGAQQAVDASVRIIERLLGF